MKERLINQISFDIRNILPNINENIATEDLYQNVNINQYLNKADEINQLNLAKPESLLQDISQILIVDDSNIRGIGYACLAGIHTFNGNYKKAIVGINRALNLSVGDKVYAYILTEYANLLRQLLRTDEAIAVLNRALDLTNDEKLKWRINTYKGFCYKYIDKKYSLDLLNAAAYYYGANQEFARHATVLRHIGLLHIHYNEFEQAKNVMMRANIFAENHSLKVILQDIRIDNGWLYIKQNNFREAREIYLKLLKENLMPYMESLVLQNLGYLEYECKNYKEVINYHKDSLKITSANEIFEMLFEDYYKLGIAHEKIGDYYNAKFYYSKGYESLLIERKQLNIILLSGYRQTLMDNYMRFLSDLPSIQDVSKHPKTFEFIENKSYREILSVFQKNLLILHKNKTNTIEDLCKTLKISQRLYFVYQNKLDLPKGSKKLQPSQYNQHFSNYLFSMMEKDWTSAIKQFDIDLYRYLLIKYQNNKSNIAKVLDVSNLTVLNKTVNLA